MLKASLRDAPLAQFVNEKGAEKAAPACPERSPRAGDDHAFVAPEGVAVGPGGVR